MRQAIPNSYQPKTNLNNLPRPAQDNPATPQTSSRALYTLKIIGIGIGMLVSYLGLAIVLGVIIFIVFEFTIDDSLSRIIAIHATRIGGLLAAAIVLPFSYMINFI